MRASFLLVAGLALAACSSTTPSAAVNPQAQNVADRLAHPPSTNSHVTFEVENITSFSFLTINALIFKCVGDMIPRKADLGDRQSQKFEISAKTDGECKGGTTEVDMLGAFIGLGSRIWRGDLDIWYNQQSGWTAKLLGFGRPDVCADPNALTGNGIQLHDNEHIRIFFCK